MTDPTHNPIRYGDEMQCAVCGKAWAIDDPDPPPCVDRLEYNDNKLDAVRRDLGYIC